MNREQFRRWIVEEGQGKRYERDAGEPVAMSPERVGHARVKSEIWRQLDEAVRKAGVPCEVLPDGITVEIDTDTDYEPDVVVNCGPRLPLDAIAAPNPLIVVEVLSEWTRGVDTGRKSLNYLILPGLRHYLIVDAMRRGVIHHRHNDDGTVATRLTGGGRLRLDPPGVDLDMDAVYAAAGIP